MPVYEFYCENCRKNFTVKAEVQARHRAAKCPKCGSKRALMRFSSFFAVTSKKS